VTKDQFAFDEIMMKPPGVGYWWRREVFSESLGKSYPWAVGFFFGNTELSLELWNLIAGVSGFDDS